MIRKTKYTVNIILIFVLSFMLVPALAQTYISFEPSITNSAGTLDDKTNLSLEVGRQWDVFSLGLNIGKTSLAKVSGTDTTTYFEIRPNLNVFQQGKFTNTFTAGIGYILNAKENLMTEITSGIEYSCTDHVHYNAFFGQYYYSGRYSASNVTFFGVSVMYYFKPSHHKTLIHT